MVCVKAMRENTNDPEKIESFLSEHFSGWILKTAAADKKVQNLVTELEKEIGQEFA